MSAALDVFWHDDCLRHDTGRGLFEAGPSALLDVPEPHPENADRLRNLRSALERGPLADAMRFRDGRHALRDELERFHDPDYVAGVEALSHTDGVDRVIGPTFASAGTWDAARAAAGCALAATDAVLDGETRLAYALVRPPGHHAARAAVDGYCFFNNAALAAQRARDRGIERVAVVDWDVHHGNGTQSGFYDRGDVLTLSVHMDHRSWGRNHPEQGTPDELGTGAGRGANVNVALPYGCGDRAYAAVFEQVVAPVLRRFGPGLIVCATGQDASQFDPNGRQCVTLAGFNAIGVAVAGLAEELCDGRVVATQEGGYGPTYSALCLVATLAGLLRRPTGLEDPLAYLPDGGADHGGAVAATLASLASCGSS